MFMKKNKFNKLELTKLQINEKVLPASTNLSNKYVVISRDLSACAKYLADMLRDFTEPVKTPYPYVKDNSSNL